MPVASYQCNSARRVAPSANRTRARPLRFLHRPRPYCRRRRFSSRICRPTANVSTSLISPKMEKSTGHRRRAAPLCQSSGSVQSRRGDLRDGSSCRRRLSPERRCLNPSHRSVSESRSSNPTCSFPASGSPTGFTPDSHSRPHPDSYRAVPARARVGLAPTGSPCLRWHTLAVNVHPRRPARAFYRPQRTAAAVGCSRLMLIQPSPLAPTDDSLQRRAHAHSAQEEDRMRFYNRQPALAAGETCAGNEDRH
ncbi:hypothetical protein BH24ACI5_BH24ACI5_02910 [soil metagenome]